MVDRRLLVSIPSRPSPAPGMYRSLEDGPQQHQLSKLVLYFLLAASSTCTGSGLLPPGILVLFGVRWYL